MAHDVFRDGMVHVLEDRCPTCIFRPGNAMMLPPGRVKGMVDNCRADPVAGHIPCHSTIHREDRQPAICRGYWDSYRQDITLLVLAERMQIVTYDPVPEKDS